MGNLISGIAPTASAVAQSTQQASGQPQRGVDGNVAANTTAQRAVVSGAASAAAVVSLSGNRKSRGASYGEGRSVDATFEKGGATEQSAKKAAKKDSALNVKA